MTGRCVVTGVASGMGEASARALKAAGYEVIGWDRRVPPMPGGWIQVDVTDPHAVEQAWAAAAEGGPIRALVNAAGIWQTERFQEVTLEDWRRTFSVNVEGTFLCCSAAVRHMAHHGGGAIVTFSSLAAMRPPKIPSAPYAASKGAIYAFTRALAAEVGSDGIRVNAIMPGAIETPMLTMHLSPEELDRYRNQSGLKRLGTADEVAALVVFLLSDAASLVHGASIEVPGA
jgi:NAD(P)-dependent dehydrogenase (short-subunit alcohol dehydrogenase family)